MLRAVQLAVACVVVLAVLAGGGARGGVITIQGDSPLGPGNYIPFGKGDNYNPYKGFIYKNIPAFDLSIGDILAFDLGRENDQSIVMDIALGKTAVNGGIELDGNGFTTIVTAGTPLDPNGNNIRFDYELGFIVEAPYSFSGGGLVIRFRPVGTFLGDTNSQQVLMYSNASDTSGYFVQRFYGDLDGTDPWNGSDDSYIGNFQITTSGSSVPEPTSLALLATGAFGFMGYGWRRKRKQLAA